MLAAMRVVFFGSPEFALPTLRRLIASEHEVVAVYTQPDKPTGRGRKLAPPPVKTLALEHGIDVRQPRRVSAPDAVDALRALRPEIGVLAAYGQILKQPVLDVPPFGILNVHASLLPRWRGAAPIPAAILAGDAETGATLMQVRLALDAGPMLDRVAMPIGDEDTTATLTPRVAEAGARLLMDVLPRWAAGEIAAEEQDEALATYAPQLEKTDARIDWTRDDAMTAWRKVRAYNPWPMAYTHLDGEPLRIIEAIVVDGAPSSAAPGTVVEATDARAGFGVVAADGSVLGVVRVQAAGRGVVPAADFVRGRRKVMGMVLGAG
jgi:methionyl-tRNA formyltransferase